MIEGGACVDMSRMSPKDCPSVGSRIFVFRVDAIDSLFVVKPLLHLFSDFLWYAQIQCLLKIHTFTDPFGNKID